MTSEAYVWITLPGRTTPTVAGHIRIDDHGGTFFYGTKYLSDPEAVAFDPVELPLVAGERHVEASRHGGLPGALRDSSPDGWGRYVLGAHTREIAELDLLLQSPDDRVGALSFSTDREVPPPAEPAPMTLEAIIKLAAIAQRQHDERSARHAEVTAFELSPRSQAIVGEPRTSLGGARPKVTIVDGDSVWLAKIGVPGDRFDYPRVEAAMLDLARTCGIETPDARVERFGQVEALLVRRFDRELLPNGQMTRTRFVSALTCFKADERDGGVGSYPALAEVLRQHGRVDDGIELYRRMAFNALTRNTDDHMRNHGLIGVGTRWRLSPAYDLVPMPTHGHGVRLAMSVGSNGRNADVSNLLSMAGTFGLSKEHAEALLNQMARTILNGWESALRNRDVPAADLKQLRSAFVNPGLGFDPSVLGPPHATQTSEPVTASTGREEPSDSQRKLLVTRSEVSTAIDRLAKEQGISGAETARKPDEVSETVVKALIEASLGLRFDAHRDGQDDVVSGPAALKALLEGFGRGTLRSIEIDSRHAPQAVLAAVQATEDRKIEATRRRTTPSKTNQAHGRA